MDREAVLDALKAERDCIDAAIKALDGGEQKQAPRPSSGSIRRKRAGGITAAGRRKLSQMMKARWAARRKAAGSAKKK